MDSLSALQARMSELDREWTWLHDTLNAIARVRAEQGEVHAFRLMQAQAMRVGQRRVELATQIEELRGLARSLRPKSAPQP